MVENAQETINAVVQLDWVEIIVKLVVINDQHVRNLVDMGYAWQIIHADAVTVGLDVLVINVNHNLIFYLRKYYYYFSIITGDKHKKNKIKKITV